MSLHSPKKSSSLGTITTSEQPSPDILDREEIIALTHDVKKFSDSLARLKMLFTEGIDPEDDARVVIHEGLGEVLSILNPVMQHYAALQSPDIFAAARNLITLIKDHDYEEEMTSLNVRDFCDAIDQLALTFSSSVSEYLMGDMGPQLVMDLKTKSMNNVSAAESSGTHDQIESVRMSPEEIDAILVGLDKGLSLALQRAKVWSRYIADVITYIERKTQLELDYAKNLSRLANAVQNSLKKEVFLPLQSVYCTALTQDVEFASNLQATQAVLHSHKFVEPLSARRTEHDKMYKSVKEQWHRECKKMNDTVTNLRKAHSHYMSRQQDHDRARDLALKADGEKQEKRRKAEEEAMHKAAEAETTYKACVAEANYRQQELFKVKGELLAKIREQIQLCDQVLKEVTMEYFKLYNIVFSPLPLQFQTLSESSRNYQPGSQYAEYVRRLPGTNASCQPEVFVFDPYVQGQKSSSSGEARKESFHSNGSVSDNLHSPEGSPVISPRRDKYRIRVKAWGQQTSDTDSASCSSKSHESSPSGSPHRAMRRNLVSSQSLDEVTEEEIAAAAARNGKDRKAAAMRRTATVADTDNLELPGMLLVPRGRRNTTFGVDFQEQVDKFHTTVPPIVSKCLSEIDKRGVMIKGIYRVSGVKSKVEHLCQRFDIDPEAVDLEDVHPNIISNVLKLYLRQLPEPLLTFRLYSDFIHAAKPERPETPSDSNRHDKNANSTGENMSGQLFGEHLLDMLKRLISKLPSSNLCTCAVLMHHLHRVASHSEFNQMSASNLGIVFGPTLLRPLEGSTSLASLVDTPHQTRAIELLITHAHILFGPSEDFPVTPSQTPVEQLNQALAGVFLPAQAIKVDTATTVQKTKVSQASIESDDRSLPVFDSPSGTPGAISIQPSASEFLLPGTASQDRNVSLSLASSGNEEQITEDGDDIDDACDISLPDQSKPLSNPYNVALSPQCIQGSGADTAVVRSGTSPVTTIIAVSSPAGHTDSTLAKPTVTKSASSPHVSLTSKAQIPSSLSTPGMGSGSDMAALLSSSMSEMAFALMVSSGSSASFEMSSSGIGQTASTLSDSFGTDWTSSASRSPQTVQESITWSTVKTAEDVTQKTGLDDLSKKKLHSQQLQNIKFLTQAPAGEESTFDLFPKEISTQAQIESTIQKQPGAQISKPAAASGVKDTAVTKAPSPSQVELVTESRKEQKAPVTTPESFQEPTKSRAFMSEASSSRRSVLEEMPIPTVSKPTAPSRADGIGPDDATIPCVTIPASPTIKRRELPSKIPTSPSVQRSADVKYAGEKLDNRADKFRQEQRKLVKAIKSDAKIGVIVAPSELTSKSFHGAQGKDLSMSLPWDHKRSSSILENVVSGGCALSSRPSSQSDEAGRDEWREESTPSPDETDSDLFKSDRSTSQTTSSVASQEIVLSPSPQKSDAGKTDPPKHDVQVSPKQKSSSFVGEGISGRTTSGRKQLNVPSTSLVKRPIISSTSSATKVITPTSVARTTSSSSTVASSRSLQGPSAKSTPSVGVVRHISTSSDHSLKGSSKPAASSSKLEESSPSSKPSSSLPKKSTGKDVETSQSPKAIKRSGDDSKSAESSIKPEGTITDKSSTSSSQSSSPRHRHHSGEAGSLPSGRSTKSSQRKPAAPSTTSTGSPRKIHEKCQVEKSSSFTSKSGGQQGSSVPKYVAARPSQLSGPVTSASPSSSSPSTPTSTSSKLSQDRTPRLV